MVLAWTILIYWKYVRQEVAVNREEKGGKTYSRSMTVMILTVMLKKNARTQAMAITPTRTRLRVRE